MAKWDRRQFLRGLMATVAQLTISVAAVDRLSRGVPVGVAATRPLPAGPRTLSAEPGRTADPVCTADADATVDGTAHELEEILPPGQRFGRWRVVAVHPVKLGAVPIVLSTWSGTRFQVDVLRRDGVTRARRGISETSRYALYLSNSGRGTTPTPEEHGLGVMWLAALLRTREHRVTAPPLLTLRDRLGRFPEGKFDCIRPAGSTPEALSPGHPDVWVPGRPPAVRT